MAPRLSLMLMMAILPGGCAAVAEEPAATLRQAMEAGLAGLTPAPAAPGPDAAPPPGTRPTAARDLLGAAPEALRRLLGEPTLRRAEGPAEVWLYAGGACALDVILYRGRDGLRVAHAAARANGTQPRTEAVCLSELAATPGLRPIPAAGTPAERGA